MHWKRLFDARILSPDHVSRFICCRRHESQTKSCFSSHDRLRYEHSVNRLTRCCLIICSGFFNTLGRFAGGPIAMIPGLNALRVHNALLFTAGILTVLAAYAYNFTTAALYAGFCGFAIGTCDEYRISQMDAISFLLISAPHMSLLPSVICDCVGLDRYTTAFGILFLFRGVTSIIGPPAAGLFFLRVAHPRFAY